MTDKDPRSDHEFEALLQSNLPELPPDNIAPRSTPWRTATLRCLAGLALTTLHLNFFGLQYLLPTLGFVLMLLGFRALRKENNGFAACYGISIARLVLQFTTLILNATVYQELRNDQRILLLGALLAVATLLCFWAGIALTQEKAGVKCTHGAPGALVIWYLVLLGLAVFQAYGIWIALLMIVVFFCILYCLNKLFHSIDDVGHAIHTAPVRISDRWLAILLTAVLTVGVACGYLFFNSHPMEWTAVSTNEHAWVQQTKAQLQELGYPAELLNDLSAADLAACRGATKVELQTNVYDAETDFSNSGAGSPNLAITGVAVKLGDTCTWQLFHHFSWIEDPGFYGTEAIKIQYNLGDPWISPRSGSSGNAFTGRLLCARNGQTCAASYDLTVTNAGQNSAVASFSFPRKSSAQRGYISYCVTAGSSNYHYGISWMHYIHQRSWLQYPVSTAGQQNSDSLSANSAYATVQDELRIKMD